MTFPHGPGWRRMYPTQEGLLFCVQFTDPTSKTGALHVTFLIHCQGPVKVEDLYFTV